MYILVRYTSFDPRYITWHGVGSRAGFAVSPHGGVLALLERPDEQGFLQGVDDGVPPHLPISRLKSNLIQVVLRAERFQPSNYQPSN